MIGLTKTILFVSGLLVGTAGKQILTSKDAKKVYTHATAAVLRMKDSVIETVTKIHETAEEILSDAKDLNESHCCGEEVTDDECDCDCGCECNENENEEENCECECDCEETKED